jgi:hypothetical protein
LTGRALTSLCKTEHATSPNAFSDLPPTALSLIRAKRYRDARLWAKDVAGSEKIKWQIYAGIAKALFAEPQPTIGGE